MMTERFIKIPVSDETFTKKSVTVELFKPETLIEGRFCCYICKDVKNGKAAAILNEGITTICFDEIESELSDDEVTYRGGYESKQYSLPVYVGDKAKGLEIHDMFEQQNLKVLLDYCPKKPDETLIRIGACDNHYNNLEHLRELVYENESITPELIKQSLDLY